MITRLHVRGYKALRDIDTSLEPLTVIVGPNGCGKTSVLESIAMARDVVVDEYDITDSPRRPLPADVLSKGVDSETSLRVGLRIDLDAAQQEYLRSYEPTDARVLNLDIAPTRHGRSLVTCDPPLPQPKHMDPDIPFAPPEIAVGNFLLRSISLLGLDVKAIARPSHSRDVVPEIGSDGSGLATVVSWLQGERHEKFEEIQARLREFVPEVEQLRTRRVLVPIIDSENVPIGRDERGKEIYTKRAVRREEIGNEILLDFRHAKGVPAKHASEGTLLLLGLLTVVHTRDVSVLLLDDVDRALHPKAQQQLVGYLRGLTRSGVQVIATSHSPYLVLHLEYEEVRAMMMSDAGGALIGSLTDHPEYERWRESMTPSEFWTVFGEEWLTTARAKADGNG